jgi:hypothetical protein
VVERYCTTTSITLATPLVRPANRNLLIMGNDFRPQPSPQRVVHRIEFACLAYCRSHDHLST